MSDETKCYDRGAEFVHELRVVLLASALFDATHPVISAPLPAGFASTAARRWARCVVGVDPRALPPGDDAGHVIANDLGGSGQGPNDLLNPQYGFNIYPQHSGTNREIQRTREGRVRRIAELGNRVCIQVFLEYPRSQDAPYPARPDSVIYDVWVNGSRNPDLGGVFNFAAAPEPRIYNPLQ